MKKCYKPIKRKHRKRKIFFAVFLILGAIIAACCIFVKYNVTPVIVSLSRERIRSLTSDAVSQAVIDVMVKNEDLDYMTITRDDKQNIQSVDIDGQKVSKLAQEITLTAQRYINEIGSNGINIPIGSLSGITMFTGLGPDLNVKIYLVGSTHTRITSVFTSAGINQTVHKLYFNITGDIAVAVPGLPSSLKTSAQVLMGETVIVGEVPPTYLQSTSVGDMLDLVVK